jgi:hypothetical protein
MIDFATDINEDLEKTQPLPVLTAELQIDEALQRKRAERIEIVELMRQNLQQAIEIEQLRSKRIGALFPHAQRFTHTIDPGVTTEERLFEVCGALKNALSKVLNECGARSFALNCGSAASRMLEDSCYELERILSAPGFFAPAECYAGVAQKDTLVEDSQTAARAILSIPVIPGKRLVPADESRAAAG